MNDQVPDWQDGEFCYRCRTQFTLVARKHHCRNCGNIFCAKCSSQSMPLPKLNFEKSVRVCDGCFDKLSSESNKDPLNNVLNEDIAGVSRNSTNGNASHDKHHSKSSKKTSKSTTSSISSKPAANASAPSEQELREEEELQLALALSLSETPAKISFPEIKQFEEARPFASTSTKNDGNSEEKNVYGNKIVGKNSTSQQLRAGNSLDSTIDQPQYAYPTLDKQLTHEPKYQTQVYKPATQSQPQASFESPTPETNQDIMRFVTEAQSTAEIFMNRINSNKARNRPIASDSAIQTLFLKLTEMHTRLLEHIKSHDEERAGFERIQDKLSQISDARAALDALREEYQDKIRQEAAEAERQRQSQLALKLEMMRQKKAQMMQYQREVAMQRIQAQELMLRQDQVPQELPPQTVGVPQTHNVPIGATQPNMQVSAPDFHHTVGPPYEPANTVHHSSISNIHQQVLPAVSIPYNHEQVAPHANNFSTSMQYQPNVNQLNSPQHVVGNPHQQMTHHQIPLQSHDVREEDCSAKIVDDLIDLSD